ncbi:hypothetical protein [Pedobacter sp. CFBP9032]|uniref:hypothetical protein n=1 Tax=Pedobacter sp. CFBP9032 TaxID=3096539 RepID=UPI002A6B2DEA|nr:hypothetical protein [Pedobacter sp. CFBP9032]MDY0904883.1 hypothetical protein [Pedobacter sp. CFBP9032]
MNQLFQFIQKFDAPLEAYISIDEDGKSFLTLRYHDKKPEINVLFDNTISEFAPKLQHVLNGQVCHLEIEPCPDNENFEITIMISGSEEDRFTIYEVQLSSLALMELSKYDKATIALNFRTENSYKIEGIEFNFNFTDSQESIGGFENIDPSAALALASQLNPGILDKGKRLDIKK